MARIALTVRDTDGNSSSRSFNLIVGEPSLSGLMDLVTLPGNPTNLVVQVNDTESDALTVTGLGAMLNVSVELTEEHLDGVDGLHIHALCEQDFEPLQRIWASLEPKLEGLFDRLKVADADTFDFVHGIVEAHAGGVSVVNVPGGCRFDVVLPRGEAA